MHDPVDPVDPTGEPSDSSFDPSGFEPPMDPDDTFASRWLGRRRGSDGGGFRTVGIIALILILAGAGWWWWSGTD